MAEILAIAIAWLKSHVGIVVLGFLGACFSALLSKEKWQDRLVGALAGFILCVVFSEHAANVLANGNYPELFGFVLGSMGKSTAETLLKFVRSKLIGVVQKESENVDSK